MGSTLLNHWRRHDKRAEFSGDVAALGQPLVNEGLGERERMEGEAGGGDKGG